ncbi:apolipoprotein Bb, tandem duplicate 1 [Xyrauchen texanus]|uniref:apolipoprotein Bb, tandem duplicate 1 n=1 Tax=Xyrauchen texanus TaxID=154827 RepID=UPI002241F8F9|nr:apolipoprotein Bb, tandem duplicate 1 [Xyrauchen texanus]
MGDNKLYLLMLLCTIVLTDAQEQGAPCLLAKRYKSFHRYEYTYETESLNALNGAMNGPKASCKVEIDVPGTCSYIVRTTECTLNEVVDVDAEGKPVFEPSAGADDFKAAMEKNPLKFTVEEDNEIKLFPEDDEPVNILNIKRGLISALAVPVLEEDRNNKMPTIYGLCKTGYSVNTREDIATDVTLNRDLSKCDHFRPLRDHTSPLALMTGMHYPIAQLIRSSQTCNYKFDNEQKHMTSGACTENHILVPFSYKGEYGVTNVGKQALTLVGVTEYNDRIFDHNVANMKTLYLDGNVNLVHPIQNKDGMLTILRELAGLSETNNGHNRAHLAHKLVAIIRKMNAETLATGLPEALEISRSLTYQVLFQCGTPECSSAILQVLRTFDSSSIEIDAAVYAMGMFPNPSRVLVKEMLEMAKFKASKPIYYALSNAVRRLYEAEGHVTPEIQAVADYALEQIGDCTGDQEHIYLSLRVIGNMAVSVGTASPALKSAIIQCVNQPAASPEVQQAAIQVFKQTHVPEEGREVLVKVLLDEAAPIQKRVAAYLIVMKDPQPSELANLVAALSNNNKDQAMSFVNSHLNNFLSSTAPGTKDLRDQILNALQGNKIQTVMDPTKYSRNYKIGSLEGNVIFESADLLPNEVMLEMTLNAFGNNLDMIEVGMNGKGLEPTIDALIGIDGFFRDTMQKTINYAADKMPRGNEVLENMFPHLWNNIKMKQVPQNIFKEITNNVNKLIQKLKAQDNPEAMIYLRLLGTELGYLKTKDMEDMANSAALLTNSLLKMFPTDLIRNLFSSTNNDLFLHYIFMDNEFYLPTGTGVPLRVALSGTFAPGVKGGLRISRDMSEIAFMPSAGIEFVTELGAVLPDYVQSGLEMHTNIYHESGLRAKVAVTNKQIKLTIPAPQTPAKLISVTNSLVSVTGAETKTIPPMRESINMEECSPLLPGLKYCSTLQYSYDFSSDASPYFPLTGDSKFVIELHPTGEVSEYTATVDYAYEEEVDKVTFAVKAEGTSFEGTAKVMFNREKYTIYADLQIPDYNLQTGLRIGAVDPNTKGKATHSIQIDFINKNITQAYFVALAKVETMEDAMLQVQLLVPHLQVNAEVTANLKCAEGHTLELESDLKLPQTSSVQKVILKFDAEKIEAEVKSDVSSEIQNIIPIDAINAMVNNLLDQQIGQSEMKIKDVLMKPLEASNAYLEQYAAEFPYVQELSIPALLEITLPERLFLNVEAAAKYKFGQDYYTISIPVPHGDFNFPSVLTTPHLAVPQLGLEVASINIPIPEVSVPDTLSVSMPVLGMAEVSSKLSSNFYNMEATASAGKEPDEHPKYSAKIKVIGTSPVDLLSIKFEGSALLTDTPGESLKAEVKTAVIHKLIDVRVSVLEEVTNAEKIQVKSTSNIKATSPLGVKISLEHSCVAEGNEKEISGYGNLFGSIKAGPLNGYATHEQTLLLFPYRTEARIDSTLKVDFNLFQAQNIIEAAFTNGELAVVSKTKAFEDILTNNAELTYKGSLLALKSDTKTMALGLKIQNIAEASAGPGVVNMRIETAVDRFGDRISSQIAVGLDVNGLAVNSNASANLADYTASHKYRISLTMDGLAMSGTTSLKSPLILDNNFNGALDASKLSFSVETKGAFAEMTVENTNSLSASLSSVVFKSKADAIVADGTSYMHDISLQVEPYSTLVRINNHLTVLHVNLVNEAQLKAEPYKADLTGSLKLAAGEEELKHTYEIRYADLVATAKCSTAGNLMGSHMSHNSEVEIAGLAVTSSNVANFNSRLLRFDGNIHVSAVPFSLVVDALANADGDLHFYGKQSAQVFTKFLLKAEPLAFAHSHECRVSTTHNMDNGVSIETNLDNKVDTVMTPSEQKAIVRMKSKINNHILSQDMITYNTPERLGIEMSGSMITNLFNTVDSEKQDHFFSTFLKYDKNTNSRVISLPLIENIPAVLEHIRITFVRIAEALQDYINREDVVAKIQNLPQHISDFVNELKLEESLVQIRKDLIAFTQKYAITVGDQENSLVNLRTVGEKIVTYLATRVDEIAEMVKEIIASGTLSDTLVQRLTEELNTFNEKYDIRAMVIAVIETVEDVIKQIDMIQFKDIALLNDLDEQYAIKTKLEETVSELKQMVANFDQVKFTEDLKNFVTSVNFRDYAQHIVAQISNIIETAKQLLTELDIIGRLNSIYSNVREILVQYELEQRIGDILNSVVEVIDGFKIEQTVQVLANILKSIQIRFKQLLDEANTYLKTTEVKQVIEHLNICLENFTKSVKSFDYNAFVEEANKKIKEYTNRLNSLIVSYEIPEKIEATRQFVNYYLTYANDFLEKMRSVKVADVVTETIKDIERYLKDCVVFSNIKAFAERLRQSLNEMEFTGKIDIPKFPTLYSIYMPPITIHYNDIKKMIIEIIDIITNFDIQLLFVDDFFGELRINYLPDFSAIMLPEINLPEMSLPAIPKFIAKRPLADIKIPEFKLPSVPSELMMPCFGKLYGEVKVTIPIFNMKTTAEFYNSTESAETPQFSAYITSHGTSSEFEILKYSLDSTARVAVPKMSRVIVAETLKITHSALGVEHQASVTLYGFSAQATAKSTVKVITAPYSADVLNTVFFALEDGMSANVKTTYNDKVNIPFLSLTSEHFYTHQLVASQDGLKMALTFTEGGKGIINVHDISDEINYKSALDFTISPMTARLTYTSDAESGNTKIKDIINIDAVALSYIDFNARIERNSSSGDTFLLDAFGKAHLREMKVEMKATHDTKIVGKLSGTFSNVFTIMLHPTEVVFDFLNKGNAKVSLPDPLSAKIDFQNDYTIILNNDKQQMSIVAFARFNQYKYNHNFTVANSEYETSIYAAVNGEANLEFLTIPFSIPSIPIYTPLLDFTTSEISDINLYEHTGLKHLLTTLDQTIDVDAKIVYQKSKSAPIFEYGLINVPSLGNLISEVSFKSSIFNLNANAGMYREDNLVIRFGAISASVFEGLKAKFEGTSSLSTKSGLKLSNAVLLENTHIDGKHESTVTFNTNNFEGVLSGATTANINLPIFTAKANHQLTADNKALPNVASNLKIEYTFDFPIINLAGNGDAENKLKFEGALNFISVETATKGTIDGTFLGNGIVKGVLNNEESIYLNGNSLQSTLKTVGNGNLNYGDLKVGFDVDENLAFEATVQRVYAVLKFSSKNEVNIGDLKTNGEHSAQATIDLELLKSLTADVKIYLSQPSTLGDLSISEILVAELSVPKQKVDYSSKIVSPVYTTNVHAKLEGNAPFYKAVLKAAATSPVVFLVYDFDSSMDTIMENDALMFKAKAVLTHADFTIDISNAISMSEPSHTLNVDITSPTFTDINYRFAAQKDGTSASVSTPSIGYLSFQLQGRIPSQMNARIYSSYASAPENDVDILIIKAAEKGEEKIILVTYNLDAPHDMLVGLKDRLPAIFSSIELFAEKHGILGTVEGLKKNVVYAFDQAYTAASSNTPELSKLSILLKNIAVQYQKNTQTLLDAFINFLRETHWQLPGMDNETTLPEICKKISSNIAAVLEQLIENLEVYLSSITEAISTAEVRDNVRSILKSLQTQIVDAVKHWESFDVILEKLGHTHLEAVEKLQEFVDSIKFYTLEDDAVYLNTYYTHVVSVVKMLVHKIEAMLTFEQLNVVFEQYVEPFCKTISKMLREVISSLPNEPDTVVKFSDGRLEIELPLPFFQ